MHTRGKGEPRRVAAAPSIRTGGADTMRDLFADARVVRPAVHTRGKGGPRRVISGLRCAQKFTLPGRCENRDVRAFGETC